MTNRVAVDKLLELRSVNGPAVTAIVGSRPNGPGAVRCVYLTNGASLSGFTLTNGATVWGWDTYSEMSGGGVWCESTNAVVCNCVLVGNSACGDGGGAYSGTLNNCTLTNNSADQVGGGASHSTLYNCTLTGNSASVGGGAYMGTLDNCIVYFNTAPDGPNYAERQEEPININYTCTTPMPTTGEGNIDSEPAFVNPSAGDLRLHPDSPCIDAGTILSAVITNDLCGLPRPLDGNGDGIRAFDMGEHEFSPYCFESNFCVSTNGFHFTIRGEPGRSVRIEVSTDLIHWEPVATVPIPVSGQTLIDPAATTEPHLFYRTVLLP
jgi:hypothetical protein